tara:strand:- start:209 stop:415 length:207 start_codon:yes stop_codon:yes gene_type:complete
MQEPDPFSEWLKTNEGIRQTMLFFEPTDSQDDILDLIQANIGMITLDDQINAFRLTLEDLASGDIKNE